MTFKLADFIQVKKYFLALLNQPNTLIYTSNTNCYGLNQVEMALNALSYFLVFFSVVVLNGPICDG